jgi:hypothetical protein
MDEQGGGVLLVIRRHLAEAIVDGRLEFLERSPFTPNCEGNARTFSRVFQR